MFPQCSRRARTKPPFAGLRPNLFRGDKDLDSIETKPLHFLDYTFRFTVKSLCPEKRVYAIIHQATKIEDICASARAAGAYGAKISGAGMGGSIIALVKDMETGKRVVNACKSAGARDGWVSSVAEGVEVQSEHGDVVT